MCYEVSRAVGVPRALEVTPAQVFNFLLHGPDAVNGDGRESAVAVRSAVPQVDGEDGQDGEEEQHEHQDVTQREYRVEHGGQ